MADFVRSFNRKVTRLFRPQVSPRRSREKSPSFLQRFWGTIPSYLPFYILFPALVYAVWYGLQPATVIAPFHLPPEDKVHPLPFSGEAVADVVQDAITSIRQEAEGRVPPPPCDRPAQKDEQFGGLQARASTAFEVRGPVTVEVKGISPEAIASAAREVLGKERYISGDVILDSQGTFRLMAQANDAGPWMTKPQQTSLDGLQWASCELGERILGSINRNVLAAAWIRRGKYDAVIGLYGNLPPREADPEALNNLGVALREKCLPPDAAPGFKADRGCLEGSIARFRQALASRREFPEAHYNLASSLAWEGLIDEAIAEDRKAIELKPDDAFAHNNLAVDLRDNGQTDGAIAEYRKAIELRPDYAFAHNDLGVALRAKGQIDEAIAEYREAIKLDPDFALARNNLAIALGGKDH